MERFLNPRSVVFVGVTRRTGPGAYNNLEMIKRFGYEGNVYVVHPKVREILGHPVYSSLEDIPEVPDVAVISLARERVPRVLSECAGKGIKRVIIISQGFADADEQGKRLQQGLTSFARKHGIRIIGPNTIGVLNHFSHFTTAFVDIQRLDDPPPLTSICQSGVFQGGAESLTGPAGKSIDIGNACDVDFVDVLEYLESDPQTQIIAIHMEGLRRGKEFLNIASRIARSKPIVVFKTGRSPEGARAALSHTGALVGEDSVFDVAFREAGLIRVYSTIELKAVCQAFVKWRSLPGPNIGVLTATGACGIMVADACSEYGLRLAPFPEDIRENLENDRIGWHRLSNPVDIWPIGMVSGSFTNVLKNAAIGLLNSSEVHGLLIIAPVMKSPLHADLHLRATLKAIERENRERKPIALWVYGDCQHEEYDDLKDIEGLGTFASIDEAVMALSAMWRYHQYKKRMPLVAPGLQSYSKKDRLPKGLLLGRPLFEILEKYGLPVASHAMVEDIEEATGWASKEGYPVVLKVISQELVHKSDSGAVRLHIHDEQALRSSFKELISSFKPMLSEKFDGILIQEEIHGFELLVGAKRNPQFGHLLVVGMGGIYTELFDDVAFALVPVTRDKALSMLRSLKCYPILEGYRGGARIHLNSIVDMLIRVSDLVGDHPEIKELDLNPTMARSDGCWVVDGRMVVD